MDFDLESVYDEEISPLMTKIIAICKEHEMPMVASFCFENEEDGEGHQVCTTSLLFGSKKTPEVFYRADSAIKGWRSAPTMAITIVSDKPKK